MGSALPPGPAMRAASSPMDEGTLALTSAPTPGPIGLDAGGGLIVDLDLGAAALQPFDWKGLGFTSPPRTVISDGRPLFRVWGGTSLEHGDPGSRGVFFAFERPASRRQAERLFAILEFGNACVFVSEFDVPPGIPMLVGDVDPGDDVHPSLAQAGEQVFIRNPWAQRLVTVGAAAVLQDDLGGAWVYTGEKTREPAKGAKVGWN